MSRYVDIELVMKNIQQLRGCTCSYSDGIVDDVEMMMDMAPTADAIIIPEGATNGDMFVAVFNPYKVVVYSAQVQVYLTEQKWQMFGIGWWNAPYRKVEE